jgi:hypothetical protein
MNMILPEWQCIDCGASKSTAKTVRCWDCALRVKRSNWKLKVAVRANEILAKRNAGMRMTEIAAEYGISRQRVYQIIDQAKEAK